MSSVPLVAMIAIFLLAMRSPCLGGLRVGADGAQAFLRRKKYLLLSLPCSISWLPVCSANAVMSHTEPGSVEITRRTCPGAMSDSAFLVFTMGSGQASPDASYSLSKFMSDVSVRQCVKRITEYPCLDVYYRNG